MIFGAGCPASGLANGMRRIREHPLTVTGIERKTAGDREPFGLSLTSS